MNHLHLWYSLSSHLVKCIHRIYIIYYNSFWKIYCFNLLPYKRIGDQIWPCHKIGQGQPRFIIWTNLVILQYSMLHTHFQGQGLLVPEKKNFSCFYLIWEWRPAWSCDLNHFEQTFFPSSPWSSRWNLASIGLAVSQEKKFENIESEWP